MNTRINNLREATQQLKISKNILILHTDILKRCWECIKSGGKLSIHVSVDSYRNKKEKV